MAVGRISGPLLKSNLLRDGVNLAFETDLLFLDVINGRVGIKTTTPSNDLTINGTTRTTNLIVDTQTTIATFTVSGNTIASSNSTINLTPSGVNATVYQGILSVGNLTLGTNTIQTTGTNTDLNITTTGTGKVIVNSNLLVNGNLHATGNITADGNITIGNATTDTINFVADIASNIIPDITNTYNLGSNPSASGNAWATSYIKDIQTTNVTSSTITVNGINLVLPQGNTIYVSTTGSDSNAGVHENNPVASIKYALSLASAGTVVFIYAGTYTEIFPITVPAGVTVRGSGLRSVSIQPTVGTIDKDAFLLNGESTIEDLTVTGYRYNGTNNTGYAFRFASNMLVTTRSPYIRNVTILTRGSTTTLSDPYGFDSNDAGKGVFFDGSVVNASSMQASCLFHSVTFITPNQESVTATNGVRFEFINCFSYFADKGIYAYSGTTGFAGVGQTKLSIANRSGSWSVGNTISYYDTDGTTLLASGTIASISGNFININGKSTGFQTITDRLPKAVYTNGNAVLSTTQKKYGTASLSLDGTADFLVVASQPDFAFGTAAFCLEAWVYNTVNPSANQIIFDFRTTTPQWAPTLYLQQTTNTVRFVSNGNVLLESATAISLNTWTHIALTKTGVSTRIFINGVQSGSTYNDANTYIQGPVTIGARYDGSFGFNGYIDDIRISKGVPRYTTTFTPPTVALSGDLSTVLLLHLDGTNGSTTILDDGVTLQDLRSSAGGTASIISFADYSQFGAEIRSIGSANVYGNYGTYADGIGVTIYLTSQNYAFVGSGRDTSDITPAENEFSETDLYEIVKLNGAKVFYTSVNEEGDFRVGDKFYIDQKSGNVLFNNQNLNITSTTGVTFTDGTHTTTITSQAINTGNIQISGNTIQSLTGDVNVTAASGAINLQNNTYVTGNLTVTGDTSIQGNTTIGDASTDTITFVAGINSNLTPSTTTTYDLGTSSLRWNNAYITNLDITGMTLSSNTISTTTTNTDLTLTANGTGRIYVPSNNVLIDNNLTVNGTTTIKGTNITGTITQTGNVTQTGTYTQTGNFTSSGNTSVTGNTTITGYLQLPQITVNGNTISTTTTNTDLILTPNGTGNVVVEGITINTNIISSNTTNADITLTPNGTGSVVISSTQSLIVPVGTTLQRPASPSNGMLRYNTTTARYEARSGSYWVKLGGVEDISGNTRILPESTPGANDNKLYFYANNNLTAYIDSTQLFAQQLNTNNLNINNNTISSINANSNINFTTTGTGSVVFGNLSINNNTITNTSSGAVTHFAETGTGYVKIDGSNGVVLPTGSNTQRPGYAVTGMTRYNSEVQNIEVYDGLNWINAGGTATGVTTASATDIGFIIALILG